MLQSTVPQLRRPALSSSPSSTTNSARRGRSSSLTTRALFGFGKESEAARNKRLEKEEQFRLQQEVLQSRRTGAWKKVRKREKEREKEREIGACFFVVVGGNSTSTSNLFSTKKKKRAPIKEATPPPPGGGGGGGPPPRTREESERRLTKQPVQINKNEISTETGRGHPPRESLEVSEGPGVQEGDRRGAQGAAEEGGGCRAQANRVSCDHSRQPNCRYFAVFMDKGVVGEVGREERGSRSSVARRVFFFPQRFHAHVSLPSLSLSSFPLSNL